MLSYFYTFILFYIISSPRFFKKLTTPMSVIMKLIIAKNHEIYIKAGSVKLSVEPFETVSIEKLEKAHTRNKIVAKIDQIIILLLSP